MKEFIYRLRLAFRFFFPKKPCATLSEGVTFDYRSNVYNHSGNPSNIVIGPGTRIDGILMTWKRGGRIVIGKNTYLGLGSRVWSAKQVTIGDNVQIAHNVNIFDSNIHSFDPAVRLQEFLKHYENDGSDLQEKEVVIGDNAWIGTNAVILKGVTIGKNSIIGAGSIITKDVPPDCVVAGNPQRVIKEFHFPVT